MEDLDINDLPEEVTINTVLQINTKYGFVLVRDSEDDVREGYASLSEPLEVTFKISKSRSDITKEAVDNLKAESQKIRAEAESKCNRIDEQMQRLLALSSDAG